MCLEKFPDSLVVSIKEHEPLLVLRMRNEKKAFTDWLVAADGSLYEGTGYSRNRLKLLPSLKIDPSFLRKNAESGNFYPLEGMPHVSPLLELARRDYPDLYRQWKVVSYERPYEADLGAFVSVCTKKVGTIRFSPQNYSSQLKRLQYLLNEQRFAQVPFINSVDLSHGRSVFTRI